MTPSPTARAHPVVVLAAGDSVLLSAAPHLEAAVVGLEVDAVVGRQVPAAIDALRRRRDAGTLGEVAVVHVGNNGPFSARQFEEIMALLGGTRRVVFVNVRAARDWESGNNAVIRAGVERYSENAVLVDWYGLTADKPELFWDDGIHLRPEGARYYAESVLALLQAP